jgi:hypothetical protein
MPGLELYCSEMCLNHSLEDFQSLLLTPTLIITECVAKNWNLAWQICRFQTWYSHGIGVQSQQDRIGYEKQDNHLTSHSASWVWVPLGLFDSIIPWLIIMKLFLITSRKIYLSREPGSKYSQDEKKIFLVQNYLLSYLRYVLKFHL